MAPEDELFSSFFIAKDRLFFLIFKQQSVSVLLQLFSFGYGNTVALVLGIYNRDSPSPRMTRCAPHKCGFISHHTTLLQYHGIFYSCASFIPSLEACVSHSPFIYFAHPPCLPSLWPPSVCSYRLDSAFCVFIFFFLDSAYQ